MSYDFWTISNKKDPFCTTRSIRNKENLTQNLINNLWEQKWLLFVHTASSITNKENQECMSLPEFNGCMGKKCQVDSYKAFTLVRARTTDTRRLNPYFFVAQIQILIPNKYLGCGYKGLLFCRNNGWITENMDQNRWW